MEVASTIVEHFRGPSFAGVIGGGVQISTRSSGWEAPDGAPRPCFSRHDPAPNGIQAAEYIAIVPVLGIELANAVEDHNSEWCAYLSKLVTTAATNPGDVAVLPFSTSREATNGTHLAELLKKFQFLAAGNPEKIGESSESALCRDLTQSLAQFLGGPGERLTVFVSHTKRGSAGEGASVEALIDQTRSIIANTHLSEFFDASDLQPGEDWDRELRLHSSRSALLSIRTDLYASREWCQREVVIAKVAGMPVVTIDAIGKGEERGSFLMDHVPRVPVRRNENEWNQADLVVSLNLLTDECLKRAVWTHQKRLAEANGEFNVAWWAPHAPEPLTLLHWIEEKSEDLASLPAEGIRILHPDPPLGPEERIALQKQAKLSVLGREVDIMTPRLLAARGG